MEISNQTTQQPIHLIFLDIDGVMIERDVSSIVFDRLDWFHKWIPTTDVQRKAIVTNYFPKTSIENLEALIAKVSQIGKVRIVLISDWRNGLTVEDMRNRVFSDFSFAKNIISKTPECDSFRVAQGKHPLSSKAMGKYGFRMEDGRGVENRARQIEFWLRETRDKLNIKSFVIIDDTDSGMSRLFPKQFVQVDDVFTDADSKAAYEILTQGSFSEKTLPSDTRHRYLPWINRMWKNAEFVARGNSLGDRVGRTFIDTMLIASSIVTFAIHDAWAGAYRFARGS